MSSQDDAQTPLNQTMKVTEKGTYYLYSSKDSNTAVYHIERVIRQGGCKKVLK